MKKSTYVLAAIIAVAVIFAAYSGPWAPMVWGILIALGIMGAFAYFFLAGAKQNVEKAQRRQAELNAEAIMKAQKRQ